MKSYCWDAKDYATHSSAQQTWARELIAKLNLQGNENILDIGCGDGKVTAEIAAHVPDGSVVGVDNSDAMIELAQSRYLPSLHPNLSFQSADASALPFEDQFDIVFSNAALHWVYDHLPVLEGIFRSLSPGGRILLQMGGQGNADAILSILGDMMAAQAWKPCFENFAFSYGFHHPDDYEKWLDATGFRSIKAVLIPKDMTHDDLSGLAGWIRTTWLPYTQCIPESKRDEFINDIGTRYIRQYPPGNDGKIHIRMVRLEVEAVRDV